MIDKLIKYQIKYSKILLLLVLIVVSYLAYVSLEVKIDPDFGTLIPDDSEYNSNQRILNNNNNNNNNLFIYLFI